MGSKYKRTVDQQKRLWLMRIFGPLSSAILITGWASLIFQDAAIITSIGIKELYFPIYIYIVVFIAIEWRWKPVLSINETKQASINKGIEAGFFAYGLFLILLWVLFVWLGLKEAIPSQLATAPDNQNNLKFIWGMILKLFEIFLLSFFAISLVGFIGFIFGGFWGPFYGMCLGGLFSKNKDIEQNILEDIEKESS